MTSAQLTTVSNGGDGFRPPRLPRWTRQEILVLIQGKRVVESRGRGRASTSAAAVEPKWAAVSAYCRRHGVNRGALQCRKRWSNLAGDYKKIKEWEIERAAPGLAESFWAMRNDLRRERKLPGFFDRDVYDIISGASTVAALAEETALKMLRGAEGSRCHRCSIAAGARLMMVCSLISKRGKMRRRKWTARWRGRRPPWRSSQYPRRNWNRFKRWVLIKTPQIIPQISSKPLLKTRSRICRTRESQKDVEHPIMKTAKTVLAFSRS